MRYSYEFKMMCVELYHSGSYPDIPEGLNPNTLKRHIREWSRLVDLHGPEVLKHTIVLSFTKYNIYYSIISRNFFIYFLFQKYPLQVECH